ncbi:hypothetical protein PILCRDRAFT_201285 [Piloderma croceum F 1598]|uniref:Uncharacterized protein n=1 Tax=Piloderma croceum (strain F 1598) TaxID=765440 RepID=A0A0C3GH24_PILCF|nr:hypothetical protein PILCRDRAFT_201285 [Piloderma croceum F 1598]
MIESHLRNDARSFGGKARLKMLAAFTNKAEVKRGSKRASGSYQEQYSVNPCASSTRHFVMRLIPRSIYRGGFCWFSIFSYPAFLRDGTEATQAGPINSRRQYLLVECRPPRFPGLSRLRSVMNLKGYIVRIAEKTATSTASNSDGNSEGPSMANVDERIGRPEVASPISRPRTPSDSSHCGDQHKQYESEATKPTRPTLSPPPPPPPPPGPGLSSVAYACDNLRSGGFYKLGSGVEHIHGMGRACWLKMLCGFVRDVLELLKEVFRGRPDSFADLRGRGPIIVTVTVETRMTVTAVRVRNP